MKRTIRVAVSFARLNKDQLNCFAILVLLCLKNNPLFSKLPVSLTDLAALQTAYQDAMSAAALGGSKDRAAFRHAGCAGHGVASDGRPCPKPRPDERIGCAVLGF